MQATDGHLRLKHPGLRGKKGVMAAEYTAKRKQHVHLVGFGLVGACVGFGLVSAFVGAFVGGRVGAAVGARGGGVPAWAQAAKATRRRAIMARAMAGCCEGECPAGTSDGL